MLSNLYKRIFEVLKVFVTCKGNLPVSSYLLFILLYNMLDNILTMILLLKNDIRFIFF